MRITPFLPALLLSASPALAQSLDALTRWEEGRSMRAGSNVWVEGDPLDPENNKDRPDRIEPGATHVLADLAGPGVITHIWLTFLREPHPWATDGAASPRDMLFRIFWDGRPEPDVEVPVGDSFACPFGEKAEVISLPVVVEDGDSFNCFWRMPFRRSARIEVVNQAEKPIRKLYNNIDWIKKESLPEDVLYFCARYRQEYPALSGKDYLVLDAEGRGQYVGTVLAVRTRSPAWWGEGDEKIYVDGEEKPSIRGTGTEDYFLSAWGLKKASTPYFGVPFLDGQGRGIGMRTSSYRWHISDPIVFSKGLKVTFETFGWMSPDENREHRAHSWNEREDDFASVAFWYQAGPSKRFAAVPPAAERRLPGLERILVLGKEAAASGRHGAGRARIQTGERYLDSGGQFLFAPDSKEEGWVEFPFEVKEKEPLRLSLALTMSQDYGIWQPILDGTKIGAPIDLYHPEPEMRDHPLLDLWLEPGPHVLRLECAGKSESSSGHLLGIDAVRLLERRPRVKALGYDREKDWRKEQVLYR